MPPISVNNAPGAARCSSFLLNFLTKSPRFGKNAAHAAPMQLICSSFNYIYTRTERGRGDADRARKIVP